MKWGPWLLGWTLGLACMPPVQPDTPVTTNTSEDPDALCAGAERVFLRHAITVRTDTCQTEARSLVTDFVSFQNLKINPSDTHHHKSFSVIISRDTLEVTARCAVSEEGNGMGEPGDCTGYAESDEDPNALTKDRLVQEILAESRAIAGAKRVRDQGSAPTASATPATSSAGCAKDTDCKGSRICVKSECVDPPPAPAASSAPASSAAPAP